MEVAAICRIGTPSLHLGTGFLVGTRRAITAAHVVDFLKQNPVRVGFPGGDVNGRVKTKWTDADLALIELERDPPKPTCMALGKAPPKRGADVTWAGYPQLIGEKSAGRLRQGWGKVASDPYEVGDGLFVEVDGVFNPGHSGAPVVDEHGDVVGVVSASAGSVEPLLERWRNQVGVVGNLEGIYRKSLEGGGFTTGLTASNAQGAALLKALFRKDPTPKGDGTYELQIIRDEIPLVMMVLNNEAVQQVIATAQMTFQMGLGVATSGPHLFDLRA